MFDMFCDIYRNSSPTNTGTLELYLFKEKYFLSHFYDVFADRSMQSLPLSQRTIKSIAYSQFRTTTVI